jgi:hypothetical protein
MRLAASRISEAPIAREQDSAPQLLFNRNKFHGEGNYAISPRIL